MSSFLNKPYGGELVERFVSSSAAVTEKLPILTVHSVIESDFINIATGIFSPLDGFMGEADFDSVCESYKLTGSGLTWTIPIVFDVDENDLKTIKDHKKIKIVSMQTGVVLGILEAQEVFPYNKEKHIWSTFGTGSDQHPGVKHVQMAKPYLLSGKVTAFKEALDADPMSYPAGVRVQLEQMKLHRVAGFQTRNIVHRAHEYLQRIALEVCDGLLIHPIVGWKKSGDFRPEVVKAVYQNFIRDFYPKGHALLAFLKTAMRYAGPKEAVFHAIIRKNFGCSHFIVGRDHAGVGGFYGKYEAHEFFDKIPHLGIEILCLNGPFYCCKCGMIVTKKTCGHSLDHHQEISGTKVREILSDGKDPEGHFLRQEVLDYLKPLQQKGSVFYD